MSPGLGRRVRAIVLDDSASRLARLDRLLSSAHLYSELLPISHLEPLRYDARLDGCDVVIADDRAPSFDTATFFATLLDLAPTIPAILVTASNDPQRAIDVVRAGAFDCVAEDALERLPQAVIAASEIKRLRDEREAVTRTLRRAEQRLAELFESAMDAIISIDDDQRIVLFNRAASEMFKIPPNAAIGRAIGDFIPLRYRTKHESYVANFETSGATRRKMGALGRVFALRGDGSELAVEASISQCRIDGELLLTVILRDLSERVWAEAERDRLLEQFRASQNLEGLGAIAGGVAHDFNNHLAAIAGNCELAKLVIAEDSEAHRHLDRALATLAQSAGLSRQLLLCAGRESRELRTLRLQDVVGEISDLLKATARSRAALEFEIDHETPAIEADVSQLHQLLLNLVTNGVDAVENKRGRVVVGTRRVEVTDAPDSKPLIDIEPGVYCELFVRDDGRGLDAATKDRMFDPFFTSKPNHRGLGLSAVMGIAKSHRARVDVQSEPELGTTVRVLFPAAASQRLATSRPASRQSGSARVLVVDDEPLVLEMMRMVLQSRGYRVDAFASPDDALQFYRREKSAFDVAVLDLSMPLYSGLEMASALRVSKPALPIVFTSGFGRPASLGSSTMSPGTAFVDKPFQSRELVAKIQEVLMTNEREASQGEAPS